MATRPPPVASTATRAMSPWTPTVRSSPTPRSPRATPATPPLVGDSSTISLTTRQPPATTTRRHANAVVAVAARAGEHLATTTRSERRRLHAPVGPKTRRTARRARLERRAKQTSGNARPTVYGDAAYGTGELLDHLAEHGIDARCK